MNADYAKLTPNQRVLLEECEKNLVPILLGKGKPVERARAEVRALRL